LYGSSIPLAARSDIFGLQPAGDPLAALSHIQDDFVFTHDSIGLGEDGRHISPSSISQRCGLSLTSPLFVRAMPTKPARPGAQHQEYENTHGALAVAAKGRLISTAKNLQTPRDCTRGVHFGRGRDQGRPVQPTPV
jgi:hypothetical protein